MKKKILNIALTLCLILPTFFILIACGGAKPYPVEENTLKVTNEFIVYWSSDEGKQEFFLNAGIQNDEEYKTRVNNSIFMKMSFEFKSDGTFTLKLTNNDGTPLESDRTYYYNQDKDTGSISFYQDAELHYSVNFVDDIESNQIYFTNGNYYLVIYAEYQRLDLLLKKV